VHTPTSLHEYGKGSVEPSGAVASERGAHRLQRIKHRFGHYTVTWSVIVRRCGGAEEIMSNQKRRANKRRVSCFRDKGNLNVEPLSIIFRD
jgi:hypothetical protein